jgi:hypothetical protein
MNAVRLFLVLVVLSVARPADAASYQQGYAVGRLVILPGVPVTPAHNCLMNFDNVTGFANTSISSAQGFFRIGLPPGIAVIVRVTCPGLPVRYFHVPNNSHAPIGAAQVDVDVGEIVLGTPSAIAGTLKLPVGAAAEDYDHVVIGIPELGLYTQVGIAQQFLLPGVPMGTWTLRIYSKNTVYTWVINNVKNGEPSVGNAINLAVGTSVPAFPVQTR